MRIRKLAKLHGYSFCNNNAVSKTDSTMTPPPDSPAPFLQSHICHLNQSPWDVVTFSPESPSSPFQVDGDESHADSFFVDSTGGAVESSDVASMMIIDSNTNANNDNGETQLSRPGKGNRRRETTTDGGRRIPTTNSYDFYYYSGFGPRWGKRRGSRNEIGVTEAEFEDELIGGGDGGGGEGGIDTEKLDHEDDDDDYNGDEREMMMNNKKRGRKPMKARSLKSLM